MLKIYRYIIGAVFLGMCNTCVHADTQLGHGLSNCAMYNKFLDSNEIKAALDSWVMGYLSGVNFIIHASKNVDLLEGKNAENINGFIQGFCSSNPNKTVTEAANEYWFNLSERFKK